MAEPLSPVHLSEIWSHVVQSPMLSNSLLFSDISEQAFAADALLIYDQDSVESEGIGYGELLR